MLRRKAVLNTAAGQKRGLDGDPVISAGHALGEHKDALEALLEEEVLGTEENVINYLPSVCICLFLIAHCFGPFFVYVENVLKVINS